MDIKKIKLLAILSNVLIVLGLISLFFIHTIVAIIFFLLSLGLSLIVFNMMFNGKKWIRIIVNASYAIVLIIVIAVLLAMT
ncbi:hypothetical protein [Staphylococcus chromogenes]|uniref:hypothetical protein n=1 Tax=Staphylococcus chromogenes TaxID=46126 RepID=UPI000D1A55EA|nr:hypothetical protein [Staphylococcus chromogenes]MCE4966897.1 hypothetical protein [Staphylococcus chromogenes]MDT0671909.1 hypothetical protein [Staphylococcus chromogenes]MDT0674101.1 hypothetical protein [Staphylococcus chromogenes]PTG10133.1 hypothetical protein BU647_01435 [Staphylococcus chromogenes]PTG17686.1 hypothetical protein BU646_01160 [Staphylococcus chromogenes]